MDINSIAQKLKDTITAQGGVLNFPDDFPIKCESIGIALGYVKLSSIRLRGLSADKVTVTGNTINIADAQTSLFDADSTIQWTFTEIGTDKYQSAFSGKLNNISIVMLVNQGLIALDKVSDPAIFPKGLFNNTNLKVDTSTFTLNMLCDSSDLNISLISAFGLSLTNLGFGLIITQIPGVTNQDVQFQLIGTLALGKTNLTVELVVPVSTQSTKNIWILTFGSSTPLVQGLADLVKLFLGVNLFSILPDAVVKIGNLFSVKQLQVVFDPTQAKISSLFLDLGSVEPWDVVPGKFKIINTGITFNISWQNNKRLINTLITGHYVFSNALNFGVDVIIPPGNNDWQLSVSAGTTDASINDIAALDNTNIPGGLNTQAIGLPKDVFDFKSLNLEEFTVSFNPSNRTVSFIKVNVQAELEWTILKDVLEISNPAIDLTIKNPLNSNRFIFGEIKGKVTLVSLPFDLSATKEEDATGWKFVAATQPGAVIDLKAIVNQLLKPLNVVMPTEIFPSNLGVTDIGFTIDKSDNTTSYSFAARTDGKWTFQFGPLPKVNVTAAVDIKYQSSTFSGSIKGVFEFPGFSNLKVGIQYRFDKDNKILNFIFWEKFIAEYSITEKKREISLKIGDLTLGELLINIMNVIGVHNFKLEAPWTILNDISLKGFGITFDLDTKSVGVTYTLPSEINLGFITITTLELGNNNKDKKMTLSIKGRFLGKEIGDNDRFGKNKPQDVQNMPKVPGRGNAYFDLRALALGQRVSIGADKFKTIPEVIKAIKTLNTPVGDAIPIGGPGQPTFKADNGWLFATNFGILKVGDQYTIDLSVVFADPELYGLRIEMNGEKAKIFAGLKFEILYRKISDSVGVYQMELTLPNAMRYLDFGAVSVVLPVVALQIYTNGDFKVDIGFPYNMDFSRSFTVQGIILGVPVMGSGGLYFGKLSSATSNDVPNANCGQFDPVLIFGIGMQLGIGRYIDKGILKAGFSVTVVGIVEGVIATWLPYTNAIGPGDNPSDVQKSYYFKLQGTLGILGKLYGTVDFAIVKASVSLTVYVMARITYESYKAIIFAISAGVSVAVSISIDFGLFSISIDFSFSTTINETFQLGSDHTQDAPWSCLAAPKHMLRANANLSAQQIQLKFRPFPKQANNAVKIYFTPHLAVNSENNTNTVQASYVSMMFVDSPVIIKGDSRATDVGKTSFDNIIENLFKWLITAATPESNIPDFARIPVQTLKAIYAALSVKGYTIPYTDLSDFLQNQLTITAFPLSGNINATVFPMPPVFGLDTSLNDAPQYAVTFNNYSFADDNYLKALSDYFNQLAVQVQKETGNAPKAKAIRGTLDKTPLSQYIFQDYFLLTARQVIQDSIDAAQNYRYELKGGEDIQTILTWANAIQPGNLTASQVISANKTHALTKDKIITVNSQSYNIKVNDSFNSIATQPLYALTPSAVVLLNATVHNILAAGVKVQLLGNEWTIVSADTLTSLAGSLKTDINTLANNADFQKLNNILRPLATISIPTVSYKLKENDNFQKILSLYNTDVDTLANEPKNTSIENIFVAGKEDDKYLVITALQTIGTEDIFGMLSSQGKSAQIAGMIARYQMHGLRLPLSGISFADSVTPQWVTGTAKDCSMWSITGQQFPLPDMKNTDAYKITLKRNGCTYISFGGGDDLAAILKPVDIDVVNAVAAFARNTKLRPSIKDLSIISPVDKLSGSYSFQNYYQLRTASNPFVLPYDKRSDQQKLASPSPIIWTFTPALLSLLAQKISAAPLMSLQIGKFSAGKNMLEFTPGNFYGYSTVIDVSIKRVPAAEKAASAMRANTYEVIGSDEAGTALLEKLLSAMPTGNDNIIDQISLLYQPNPTAADAKGYLTDGPDNVNMFLTQVNLSTDTNPVQFAKPLLKAAAIEHPSGVINSKYDFIKLLWECSVVRSGGYYLYYQEKVNNNALADVLFDRDGNATISILITYKANTIKNTEIPLYNYMNSVVTGDQIDPSADIVASRSEENDISYPVKADDTILSISNKYNAAISEIALVNATALLSNGVTLDIKNIRYEVRPEQRKPGKTLATIASYFGVTPDAVKAFNPEVPNFDNLAIWTLLRIPNLQYVISDTAAQGNTMQNIAGYYFVTIEALAFYNDRKANIFKTGNITVRDQVLDYKEVVPQGNIGFKLNRNYPGVVPAITAGQPLPPDYAEKSLQNEYQLLTYASSDNADFKLSDFGLPVGPLKSNKTDQNAGAKTSNDDPGIWPYEQVVKIHSYAKYNPIVDKPNLPAAANNPYAGISGYAQLFLDWQDTYGNRIQNTFTDPDIDPTVTLNKQPIQVGYTDTLLGIDQWPGITTNYRFDNSSNNRQLLVDVVFDNSRYDPSLSMVRPGTTDSTPIWKQNAIGDREVYQKVYYQLNQLYAPEPANPGQKKSDVRFTLSTTLTTDTDNMLPDAQVQRILVFISDIYIYLDQLIAGTIKWDANQKPVIKAPLSKAICATLNMNNIFELLVSVGIYRDIVRVHDDFLDDNAVYEAICSINPQSSSTDDAMNLQVFAGIFETIFKYDDLVLKIATASGANPNEYKRDSKGIWIVRWALKEGAKGIFYKKDDKNATVYAARPISTQLEGYPNINIYPYVTAQGIDWNDPNVAKKTFSGIDMDAWGRQFLLSIDDLLNPAYVNATFWISKLYKDDPQNPKKEDLLLSIINSKKSLAGSLANYLEPVLFGYTGDNTTARDKFKQQMLIRLSDFYAVSAVVQYPIDVSVDWTNQEQNAISYPRLYGSMKGTRAINAGLSGDTPKNDGFSLSNSKIVLTNDNKLPSYLNFIFTVKNPKNQTFIPLDLQYQVTHLEHNITQVDGIQEYEASDWLNFVIVPAVNNLTPTEALNLPIVLRAYPTPPSLTAQVGVKSNSDDTVTIPTARQWDFDYDYTQHYAQQDTIHSEMRFNLRPGPVNFMAVNAALFATLAQFISTYPDIHKDLIASLTTVTTKTDRAAPEYKVAAAALRSFQEITEKVAHAWQGGFRLFSNSLKEIYSGNYLFSVIERPEKNEEPIDKQKLIITLSAADNQTPGLVPPLIEIEGYKTITQDNLKLVNDLRDYRYAYQSLVDPTKYLTVEESKVITKRTVSMSKVDVINFQNALSFIKVKRNENLVKDKAGKWIRTADDFVYQTPLISFGNKLIPLLDYSDPKYNYNIARQPQDLQLQISGMFIGLLGQKIPFDITMKIEISYNYTLQNAPDSIDISLPVFLAPSIPIPPNQDTNFAAIAKEITGAMKIWNDAYMPQGFNKKFFFDISVYSGINGNKMPLLTMRYLYLNINDITTWGV
ncbi:hypothetical protein [Mucilaginibacter sp.]|uniref:hypothetical protein n=1 Tax=Mucilaginibacter sp. TaxID=1882438 RepID=UPI0026390D38|nr:hypothetical protein [Mucilaginibacter sp.]MDB4921799.1 Peptidoglycan-binding lysin domain protein [Mucilaginibacter sp.]